MEHQVKLIKDNVNVLHVVIDGIDFGVFDQLDGEVYLYFPRRTEQLTGDHYIAIGNALNSHNSKTNK